MFVHTSCIIRFGLKHSKLQPSLGESGVIKMSEKKIQIQRSARNSHLLMKNPSQFPFEFLPTLFPLFLHELFFSIIEFLKQNLSSSSEQLLKKCDKSSLAVTSPIMSATISRSASLQSPETGVGKRREKLSGCSHSVAPYLYFMLNILHGLKSKQ